jgi:hypothetical protein
VSALLKKFEHLGFIEGGDAGITVNNSLLSVVLHDQGPGAATPGGPHSRVQAGIAADNAHLLE